MKKLPKKRNPMASLVTNPRGFYSPKRVASKVAYTRKSKHRKAGE